MKIILQCTIITTFLLLFSCAKDKNAINTEHSYQLIVPKLTNPWGFVFLPDKSMLITEKEGRIIHFKNGIKTEIHGLPAVYNRGQGGLLDIKLHPNYSANGWIYLTYSSTKGLDNGGHTAVMRAKLENDSLQQSQLLYKASPNTTSGQHFGSRIIFDDNGYLFFTVGERGNRDDNPQDLTRDGGKVYRLHDDGTIPRDNPFVKTKNAKNGIYSYGHRNPQGIAIHPVTREIWTHEHGPKGGDEINIIKAGKNYGWPLVTYGVNYIGTKITEATTKPGMETPLHYWTPSIAPSGMEFISSDKYKGWENNLLVGSLKFQYLDMCTLKKGKVIKEERLLDGLGRVRSINQGPDGYIYVGIENLGIVKLIKTK